MTSPTFTPRFDADMILTGPAQLWTQPWIFGTPAVLPALTIALGEEWLTPWRAIGATKTGVTGRVGRQVQNITIEEQRTPVDQKTTNATFTFTAELSEDTLETMQLAYGGGSITTVAPGTSTKGTKTLIISEELQYIVVGLETIAPPRATVVAETPWRRILVPKVSSAAEVDTSYRRADSQRVYPVTFTSLVPISDCTIVELDADPTGP